MRYIYTDIFTQVLDYLGTGRKETESIPFFHLPLLLGCLLILMHALMLLSFLTSRRAIRNPVFSSTPW